MGAGRQQWSPPLWGQRGGPQGLAVDSYMSQVLCRLAELLDPPKLQSQGSLAGIPHASVHPKSTHCPESRPMTPINLPEPCVGAECHMGNGELGTGPFHTIHFI